MWLQHRAAPSWTPELTRLSCESRDNTGRTTDFPCGNCLAWSHRPKSVLSADTSKNELHFKRREKEETAVLLFSCQVMSDSATPWTAACQASLHSAISRSLLKLMSLKLVISSNHLILCHPLLLLPSIFPSIRGFSNESALHIRWPKYWNFSISPCNKY